eukprot:TRINITY_DN1625_c0_g4_i1.p2 TRINITY_DN1625_c0_g4~~TRINITY_DN1625_c0_g4_i1.p2  ORF type:complete len:108 (-),score=20.13 TRINITY_DN1625_c0_g4_i1:462-785(-)
MSQGSKSGEARISSTPTQKHKYRFFLRDQENNAAKIEVAGKRLFMDVKKAWAKFAQKDVDAVRLQYNGTRINEMTSVLGFWEKEADDEDKAEGEIQLDVQIEQMGGR